MYSKTETLYLYYKVNNIYYKIPTYGKVFKIIDYGRAIFTYKKKTYMNDVFSENGEAGGQYAYPHQIDFLNIDDKHHVKEPNKHFDLCRLGMTILDEIPMKHIKNELLLTLLKTLSTDKYGNNFCDMSDNFALYIKIARDACNGLPRKILEDPLFRVYRIPKKKFPRKSFYKL